MKKGSLNNCPFIYHLTLTKLKMEARIVTLRRKTNTRLPAIIVDETFAHLGGGFDSTTNDTLRGVSYDEEKAYLPNLVGCSPDSFDWSAKTRAFWEKFDVTVPTHGKILNITCEKAKFVVPGTGKEITIDRPEVVLDYLIWRFAQKHSEVASNLAECLALKEKQFYIEDQDAEIKAKTTTLEIKNKARQKYLEIAGGESKDETLLRAIAVNTRALHGSVIPTKLADLLIFLNDISEKFPVAFADAASDPEIKDRAFVSQLLDYQILTSAGNQLYDETQGINAIAESIEEFIKLINQPGKSAYKAQLKVKLDSKKGK